MRQIGSDREGRRIGDEFELNEEWNSLLCLRRKISLLVKTSQRLVIQDAPGSMLLVGFFSATDMSRL